MSSEDVVRFVEEDDVAEVVQTVKRAIRRAKLVLAAYSVRAGPVMDVRNLLDRSRVLLSQCDIRSIQLNERYQLLEQLNQLSQRVRENLAIRHESPFHPPTVASGSRGRPKLVVELGRVFELRMMGIAWSDIAKTVGCSRQTLWNRFNELAEDERPRLNVQARITDDALDDLVLRIKQGHAFIGSGIVKGHLQAADVTVPLKRVKESLRRVDPLGVARRRRRNIRRRVYKVRGSNFLWHMDQNEKLQPWGFMLHGCVDGQSRLQIYVECRTNKRAKTVLKIAYEAFGIYGIPLRIRADKGTENNAVEEFMNHHWGAQHSPFIRGRSIQNVRMERQWLDIRKDTIEQFRVLFTDMETNRVLKMELRSHRLCIILTYMRGIQSALDRSRHAWNHHQIRTERNRTPIAIYALSRAELIVSQLWPGDGTRPDADVGRDRDDLDGDYLWARDVLADFDFDQDDGMDGVRVFLQAVLLLEDRVPGVNEEGEGEAEDE